MFKKSKGFLVKSYLAHNVIFNEGSQGDAAFLLTDGAVEISTSVNGRKKVLAELSPVSMFGEMALFLDDRTRTATAMTLKDSQMVVISRDALDEYLATAPQMISSIMNVLVHRLRATTRKAKRAPNVPMGVCRVLDMFAGNGQMTLKYDSAVRSLSETFITPGDTIERYLMTLQSQGHLTIEGRPDDPMSRIIRLKSKNFLNDMIQLTRTMVAE